MKKVVAITLNNLHTTVHQYNSIPVYPSVTYQQQKESVIKQQTQPNTGNKIYTHTTRKLN